MLYFRDNAHELGPKSYLTIMSRLSFSGMYATLEVKDKENFSKIMSSYCSSKDYKDPKKSNSEKSLFLVPYPLIYGSDILKSLELDIKKCLPQVPEIIKAVTINDFIESIKIPQNYENYVNHNKEIFRMTLECLSNDQIKDQKISEKEKEEKKNS